VNILILTIIYIISIFVIYSCIQVIKLSSEIMKSFIPIPILIVIGMVILNILATIKYV
jgi:hypothetical protein